MGLLASMYIERLTNNRWVASPNKYIRPDGTDSVYLIDSGDTLPGNGLLEAHLLGAFTVMDPGNAPAELGDGYRVVPYNRGRPEKPGILVRRRLDSAEITSGCASCATLAQLLAFRWSTDITYRLWVNGPQLAAWLTEDAKMERLPPTFDYRYASQPTKENGTVYAEVVELAYLQQLLRDCNWVARHQVDEIEHTKIARRTAELVAQVASFRWAAVDCTVPLFVTCENFLSRVLPQMFGHKPDEIRLVCWVT